MDQANSNSLCKQCADILGGKGTFENGVCSIEKERKSPSVTIMGHDFKSVRHDFSIQFLDNTKALNVGELVLLENEVFYATQLLTANGIIVSAVHNHWLFDRPRLMYIHVEAVMNPLEFCKKLASVLNTVIPS